MSWLKANKTNLGVLFFAMVYMAINMFLTVKNIYLFNVLPVLLLLVYLAFTRLDIVYFIIVACTPVSIPLIEYFRSSPIDFYIPTEPMLFGVMIIVLYKLAKEEFIDRRIINHPVSLAILFNLFWIFLTSITSSMPLVSFKFLLARIWFLTSFYLLAIYLFRNPANYPKMVWAYTIPLLIVIFYAINRHMMWGLNDKQAAHVVANPFYRDHTSYGAVLAMVLFGYAGINIKKNQSLLKKLLIGTIFAIILIALLLSYTRAAWISVVIGLGIMLTTYLKIKFRYLAIIGVLVIGTIYNNRVSIIHKLEKNKQDSSANITEHIQSVTNIATDASNLERLNRWAAALRMYQERPVFGWGPGTYMFKYAPFQHSSQKTVISTNFGNLGNAHSEYIGPLAESGFMGMLSFILIAVVSIITSFRVYHKVEEKRLKIAVLTSMLAFISYLIHGLLNNFLDTDKASSLFWGFIAFSVSLDIYYQPNRKESLFLSPGEKEKQ